MKIVYLHQYFNTPDMPGGTRSFEMAKRMVEAGHEVHVITSERSAERVGQGWHTTMHAGVTVHWYRVPYSNRMSYRGRITAFAKFAMVAVKKAAEVKGDVIFATSTPLTIAIPAVFSSRKNRIPMIFEVRDLWPELPIAIGALKNPIVKTAARWLERWAYRNASAVVALSNGMKEGVLRTGYPKNRIAVIPNSSDNQLFDSDVAPTSLGDIPDGGPLLVYAGTFGNINGVGYMVELANALLSIGSDIRILLVGDGQERDAVIRAAVHSGVYGKNLFYQAELPKKEMPTLFKSAVMCSCLFVDLPEMRANSANKFFDALAAGRPILINFGGWMDDIVKTQQCGLSAWNKPIDEVATELERLMHDKTWLIAAGAASKRLAVNVFDRDLLASKLIKVFETVADGNPDLAESIAPEVF